jgi:CRP-like cAMP-binding protein
MIFRNHFLASLDAHQAALLAPHLVHVTLNVGQVVYDVGQDVDTIYFPGSSVIAVIATMKDGRSAEISTIGREGVVGVASALSRKLCSATVEVQTGGTAITLPASRLRSEVSASPRLVELLMASVHGRIVHAEQLVACTMLHSLSQRLARWLLAAQDRTDNSLINTTQERLATVLGVQRTTITAAAQHIRSKGLIQYERGEIRILDRPGLIGLACECYEEPEVVQ